ncbi:MAG: DUF799 domain-containing protein [Azoarcus sp.]|nr:DUF799 domain-containing protein [Azoarcus sp.]
MDEDDRVNVPLGAFPRILAAFRARHVFPAMLAVLLSACATPPAPFDYTAYRANRPRSILVLPPVNHSLEVDAPPSLLSVITVPLAESGYYVIPVTLSEEAFRQNGVTVAAEAQGLPPARLREIFGADAALYLSIERYGVSYRLIDSVVEVALTARLIDLASGQELWHGRHAIAMGNNHNSRGLAYMLVNALISQIANNLGDRAHEAARIASGRLFSAGYRNGMLLGPYHPGYGTD